MPKTTIADNVIEGVRRGDITGNSFSFIVAKNGDTWDHSRSGLPLRTLVEIAEVFDVGPVTFSAYSDTKVSARSLERARAKRRRGLTPMQVARMDAARQRMEKAEFDLAADEYRAEMRRLGILERGGGTPWR